MSNITFNQETKDNLIKIAKEHQEADRFIQGDWFVDSRGCWAGCMTGTSDNTLEKAVEMFNLPRWIVYVGEKIFEGLPKDESLVFPVEIFSKIPVDTDLTQVWKDWNYQLLMDKERGQITFTEEGSDQFNAIKQVADLFLTDSISESAARSAESAAWSAESAARSAAESAARSAARSAESAAWAARAARSAAWAARAARSAAESAESAAWSGESAESAARSAAESAARSAAWSAARSAARSAESAVWAYQYIWMRDLLFKLLTK